MPLQHNSRSAQTQFVNSVMTQKGGTLSKKYVPDMANPTFKETADKYDGTYYDHGNKGVPKGRAEVLWGGKVALQDAIKAGSVKEIEDEGEYFYSWCEITSGQRGSAGIMKSAQSGTINISEESYKAIASTIAAMKYIPAFKHDEEKAIALTSIIHMCAIFACA